MDPMNLVILGGLAAVSGTVLYFILSQLGTGQGKWIWTAGQSLGPQDMGLELGQVSSRESALTAGEETDQTLPQGMSQLVEAHSHGIPIELSTPATRVKWGPDGVEVRPAARPIAPGTWSSRCRPACWSRPAGEPPALFTSASTLSPRCSSEAA